MARKNPLVRVGRPPALSKKPMAPMDALQRQVPAAAFNRGGAVGGYKTMPSHHDCSSMNDCKRKDC